MKHEMRLHHRPFNQIKDGTKTVELRVNDEKRRELKINDLIDFIHRETKEKITVQIEELVLCDNFEELYKHFDKISMGYDQEDIVDPKDMEKYYSKEEQEKYGVVGIKIKLMK